MSETRTRAKGGLYTISNDLSPFTRSLAPGTFLLDEFEILPVSDRLIRCAGADRLVIILPPFESL